MVWLQSVNPLQELTVSLQRRWTVLALRSNPFLEILDCLIGRYFYLPRRLGIEIPVSILDLSEEGVFERIAQPDHRINDEQLYLARNRSHTRYDRLTIFPHRYFGELEDSVLLRLERIEDLGQVGDHFVGMRQRRRDTEVVVGEP